MEPTAIIGHPRGDGRFGIRNHVIVMASVACANSVVERIAREDNTIVPITHQHGCAHMGDDREQVLRTLSGTCDNPNVGGVLLVGLGCETIGVDDIAERINRGGRLVRTLVIQELGRIDRIMEAAGELLREIKESVRLQTSVGCRAGDLTIGLECGGSDPFSGVTANPAVGLVADRLVELGATVILSEIPEMIGAEGVLEQQFGSPAVREKILSRIDEYVQCAHRCGCDLRGSNPSPGNIKAGLSSIEEKSLGCVVKGGTSTIQEYIPYAQRPSNKGLVVMDTPGNDPESVTGMVAGGAQAVLFTTGVGTPLGNPVAPVIKISSNSRTYERMRDFIDIDAGPIVEGRPVAEVADRLFEFLLEACNGRQTAAERNVCREFAINRIGPTF